MPVLQFKGKTAVECYHYTVPHHTLDFDKKLSILPKGEKPDLDGNLIIEGDNLLALKALLPTHAGRVKCVYIDPPYNTGNEGWVYNDNLTQPQFKEWIGKAVGKEGEDACRHDKWCCMMYPRLALLKELLHDEGAIFVSIDDNEVHHLRMMLDELYGEENFVATLVWQKSKKGDAKLIANTHEYILVWAKNKEAVIRAGKWRREKPGAEEVLAHYEELRAEHRKDHDAISEAMRAWYASMPKGDPRKAHSHYRWSDDRGLYFAADFSGPDDGRESRPRYDIIHPVTGKPCKKPSTGWRWDEERTKKALAEKPPRIHFGPDETTVPCRKSYLKDIKTEPFASVFYKDGRAGTLVLEQIVGPGSMDFPKDKDILAELIGLCTEPDDVVLDSFAGSGTTAHAVLELNEKDGGARKFVLVQQPFDTTEHEKAKFNICENVTAKRVAGVIQGYKPTNGNGKKEQVPGLGGSFTYARLGPRLFGEYRDLGDKLPAFEELAKYIFYTETSGEFDAAAVNKKTGRIGEHKGTAYYLLYTSDSDKDKALDTAWLKDVANKEDRRKLVVYCEKLWLLRDDLLRWQGATGRTLRPMLVPFNLK
jgi:adenine-specific DNA-methyltransferase